MLFKHVLGANSSFWGSQPPVDLLAFHFTLTSDPLLAAPGNGCVNLAEAQGGVEQTWGWELPVGSGCAQVAASYLPTLHRLPACRSLYGSVLPCPALYPLLCTGRGYIHYPGLLSKCHSYFPFILQACIVTSKHYSFCIYGVSNRTISLFSLIIFRIFIVWHFMDFLPGMQWQLNVTFVCGHLAVFLLQIWDLKYSMYSKFIFQATFLIWPFLQLFTTLGAFGQCWESHFSSSTAPSQKARQTFLEHFPLATEGFLELERRAHQI